MAGIVPTAKTSRGLLQVFVILPQKYVMPLGIISTQITFNPVKIPPCQILSGFTSGKEDYWNLTFIHFVICAVGAGGMTPNTVIGQKFWVRTGITYTPDILAIVHGVAI